MNRKRILQLAKYDFLHSLFRLKGLLFFIPYFFYWYCIIWFFIKKGTGFLVTPESIAITSMVLDHEIAEKLLIYNPAAISMFLLLSLASMPLFVMLAGNNQLASDCGRKSLRYLLIRCTRIEIFLARFFSAFLLMASGILVIFVIITIISGYHDGYSAVTTITYATQVLFIVILYSLPLLAFMSIVSAIMSSALGCLLSGFIFYICLLVADHYFDPVFSLVPSGLKHEILTANSENLPEIVTGLVIYTLVYLGLAWGLFRKRSI